MTTGEQDAQGPAAQAVEAVIPRPRRVSAGAGRFAPAQAITLVMPGEAYSLEVGAAELSRSLEAALGQPVRRERASAPRPIEEGEASAGPRVVLRLDAQSEGDQGAGEDEADAEEGYRLAVTAGGIDLAAPSTRGLFHAAATLCQLLDAPAAREAASVPGMVVEDRPAHRWRGVMLDSARRYQPPAMIRRLIDRMASMHLNTLHWHLVEDQAWRLGLESHPELARRASGMSMGDPTAGGHYSPREVRDMVAYAADRFITIVPEIEMPGHCTAALSIHPDLSCTGGPFEIATTKGIRKDIYCAGNDAVFDFLHEVLDETIQMFPGKYLHIGGDEAPKDRWEACPRCQARMAEQGIDDARQLQGWFLGRIHDYLKDRGRTMIGWDELGELDLPGDVVIQWWRNRSEDAWRGPSRWAARGQAALFSPNSHCYFDYTHQRTPTDKALALTLDHDPRLIDGSRARDKFLGGECAVWTEHMPPDQLEAMVFPRACAFAEAIWCGPDGRRGAPAFHAALSRRGPAPPLWHAGDMG